MKGTSQEISRKLVEIGFYKPNQSRGVYRDVKQEETFIGHVPVSEEIVCFYDLETILEALPRIMDIHGRRFELIIVMNAYFDYLDEDQEELVIDSELITSMKKQDESLADTAARLLILLYEKGLVKF